MNLRILLICVSVLIVAVFFAFIQTVSQRERESKDQEKQKISEKLKSTSSASERAKKIQGGIKPVDRSKKSLGVDADSDMAHELYLALRSKNYARILSLLDTIESKILNLSDLSSDRDLDIIYYLGYTNHSRVNDLLMRLLQKIKNKRIRLAIIHALVSEKIEDDLHPAASDNITPVDLINISRHTLLRLNGGLWPPSTSHNLSRNVKLLLINSLIAEHDTNMRLVILYSLLETMNEHDRDLVLFMQQLKLETDFENDYLIQITGKCFPEFFLNTFLDLDVEVKKKLIRRLYENILENLCKQPSLSLASYILRHELDNDIKGTLIFYLADLKDDRAQALLQELAAYEKNEELLMELAFRFYRAGNAEFLQYLLNKIKDPERKASIYHWIAELETANR